MRGRTVALLSAVVVLSACASDGAASPAGTEAGSATTCGTDGCAAGQTTGPSGATGTPTAMTSGTRPPTSGVATESSGATSVGSSGDATSTGPGSSGESSSTTEAVVPSSSRHTPVPVGTTAAAQGYWEYLPVDYDAGADWPLLVFLHGIDENGDGDDDLDRVLRNGPPRLIDEDEWAMDPDFVVLSPQYDGMGCPTANSTEAFIDYAVATYDVDPERVYLTGLSCGAIGGWNYLGQYTDAQVAAAVLIAGDGRNAFASAGCELGLVPIWAFHGDDDGIVPLVGTTDPVDALLECVPLPDVQATIYAGVGHNSWRRTYDLSAGHDIYAWLLDH